MATLLSRQEGHGSTLGPPRFSLRALFVVMTALCCAFALMALLGTIGSAALVLVACLVLAHVLGNALGTRLRDAATLDAPTRGAARDYTAPAASVARAAGILEHTPLQAAPSGRLTERAGLHRITAIMALGGASIGGALGWTQLAAIYPESGAGALTLAIASSAVLGAFVGFCVSSFLSVFRQAWSEALRACDPAPRGDTRH